MQDHISKLFDDDLDALRNGVAKMGSVVTAQIDRGARALSQAAEPTLEEIQAGESEINSLEILLVQRCYELIAARQPTAVDLRLVMSYARATNDLERMGDEAKKVAMKSFQISSHPEFLDIRRNDLFPMLEKAKQLVGDAVTALTTLELSNVTDMVKEDEVIDQEYLDTLKRLIGLKLDEPSMIASTLEIALIAKAIERIGDHAKNIVEGVIHVVKGTDVRHSTLPK